MPHSERRRAVPSPEAVQHRNTVDVGSERIENIASKSYPGHFPKEDHSWNLQTFTENFSVRFHKNSAYDAVFSLVGLDASLANAFRRILLSEIPTLAIEDVYITQNTSIIQDEVLAHRLGLVPLKASKKGLDWLQWRRQSTEDDPVGDAPTDYNTIQLDLKIQCSWKDDGQALAARGEIEPEQLYDNAHVYASELRFVPIGQQDQHFSQQAGCVEPVNPDILLAKLRPGHELEIVCHAVKGIGADHAKFSPVATASYRLLPSIDILQPILGAEARKFAACFPAGVIALEQQPGSSEVKAVVKNPMADTVSRECLRHEEFAGKVKLGRQRDHFIFSVESIGQSNSDELFVESVKILKEKCTRLRRCLFDLRETA